MVLLSNSIFIEELNKLCGKEGEEKKTSIWITMKRVNIGKVKNLITNKTQTDKKNKVKTKEEFKTNKKHICLIRATDGKNIKLSTYVCDNVINFSQEISKIIKF
ncbi:signal recognition particle subunit SRP14 [Hepatocystis sp. ex Piliocolobus tephrosceles]|nr:signal recognition particle subunit SRP14 [Hepatocystis sp. ex Piliocolobus tephrosceles]